MSINPYGRLEWPSADLTAVYSWIKNTRVYGLLTWHTRVICCRFIKYLHLHIHSITHRIREDVSTEVQFAPVDT